MVCKLDLTEAKRKKNLKSLSCLMNIGHSAQIPEKAIEKYGFFPKFSPHFFFVFKMSLECPKLPVFFSSNYIIKLLA